MRPTPAAYSRPMPPWGRRLLQAGAFLGNASFGPLDMAPNGDNLGRLLARWPDYNERVARFIMADPLRPHRQRLQENLEKLAQSGPQRDLFG